VKKDSTSSQKESRTKMLRKLHLVEILQTEIQRKKGIEKKDKLEQIDALTFGEETAKLMDFLPECRVKSHAPLRSFFVFMLNKERIGKLFENLN
jgi:hypothetical protein